MSQDRDAIPEPAEHDDLFVAFANTLELERGEPIDAIPDVDGLLAWLRGHGLLSRARPRSRDGAPAARRGRGRATARAVPPAPRPRSTPSRRRTSEERPLRHGAGARRQPHPSARASTTTSSRLDADRTRYGAGADRRPPRPGARHDRRRARPVPGRGGRGPAPRLRNEGCRYLFIDRSPPAAGAGATCAPAATRRRWPAIGRRAPRDLRGEAPPLPTQAAAD